MAKCWRNVGAGGGLDFNLVVAGVEVAQGALQDERSSDTLVFLSVKTRMLASETKLRPKQSRLPVIVPSSPAARNTASTKAWLDGQTWCTRKPSQDTTARGRVPWRTYVEQKRFPSRLLKCSLVARSLSAPKSITIRNVRHSPLLLSPSHPLSFSAKHRILRHVQSM